MNDENNDEWYETIFSSLRDLDEIWNGSSPNSWIDDLEQLVLIREYVQERIEEIKEKLIQKEN